MPNVVRSVSRLVDQDDVASLLGVLVDGYALTYDHATGAFTLVRHATKAELDYALNGEPAALTAAGALATLFNAQSGADIAILAAY